MSGSHGDFDPCPNCSMTTHAKCCLRCGAVLKPKRLAAGYSYCTVRCEAAQQRDDKLSSAIEEHLLTPRLDKSTRAGLYAIRSLACVTTDNGIDMSGQECSEMRRAILWLDYQLSKKR